MIKSRIVTISEIKYNNPTLCLSPNRFLGTCHNCEVFKRELKKKENKDLDLTQIIKKMKCTPPEIDKDILKKIERKKQLLKELSELKKDN